MRYTIATLATLAMLLASGFAPAEEYWEYEPFEGEYERHHPTQGIEEEHEYDFYTNDYDDVEYEREQYEWEAGEGYHEEEWYDPSDWFNVNSGTDYEYDYDDHYYGGYYDDGIYDDDWYYDYYE